MTPPPKYSQKNNAPKIFIFLKTPKYIKIQNFDPPPPPKKKKKKKKKKKTVPTYV